MLKHRFTGLVSYFLCSDTIRHCILVDLDLGPSLREICAANRSDEKQVEFFPTICIIALSLQNTSLMYTDKVD